MGKKLIVDVNDLKSVNPALASEWNYEKNGKLLPEMIFANSHRKVWWIGKCGHEWEAIVSNREKGYGCPYCSGNKVLKGFNDLMTKRPDLASEWNFNKNCDLKPDMIMMGTNKKVWWICDKGHEWEETPNNRTNAKTGCPYCSGHRVLKGFNDLQTVNPTLASEWNYEKNGDLKPTDVTIGAHQMVWWRCNEGHEWKSTIPNRIKGAGCSICSGRQVLKGVNDLLTQRPDIACEWDYEKNGNLKPDMVKCGTDMKVSWKCKKCGFVWSANIFHRTGKNPTGCPKCNESHLEKFTRDVLQKYHYRFQEQVTFKGLTGVNGKNLSYDFAIYDDDRLDALIECQGGQHYEPVDFYGGKEKYKIQLEHDRLKRDFCQRNHILLIEIPYTYSDEEIEAIFSR